MPGFENLVHPINTKPGIAEYLWLAPVSWFATDGIKKPEPPFENFGDAVIIKDDHEFLDGKGFIKLQCAPRKNKLDVKCIGDLGLNKFQEELQVVLPGSYVELHEQAKMLLNVPLIVLCYDCDCPDEMMYNLGCDCESCWMTVDFSTGFTQEGSKAYIATIQTNSRSVLLYEGLVTIPTSELQYLLNDDGGAILTDDGVGILI